MKANPSRKVQAQVSAKTFNIGLTGYDAGYVVYHKLFQYTIDGLLVPTTIIQTPAS